MKFMILKDQKLPIVSCDFWKTKGFVVFQKSDTMGFEKMLQLIKESDLSNITIYEGASLTDKNYEVLSVHNGYSNIDGFTNSVLKESLTINLSKPTKEEKLEKLLENNVLQQMMYVSSVAAMSLNDEQALNCIDLFPAYAVGKKYVKGDRFKYEGLLYKVLQEHTSQADWKPNENKALYLNVADPSIEFPEFKQPTGAHDAYMKGDKVTFEGKHYISKIDNNTYSPTDYPNGWDLVQ